jgi:hypothetical protein
MQYVNDDMDELFRRAAENYPLDTSSADWNKVLTALQGQQAEIKTVSGESKKNKNGRLLWLLLLLPLGFICYQLYTPAVRNNEGISNANSGERNIPSQKQSVQKNSPGDGVDGNKAIDLTNIRGKEITDRSVAKSDGLPMKPFQKTSYSSHSNQVQERGKDDYIHKEAIPFNSQINNQDNSSNDWISVQAFHERKYVPEIAFSRSLHNELSTVVDRSLTPSLLNSSEPGSKSNIRVERRKKFYAGVMGGVDATTVKFQKINNAGATYGVLFGYQFNRKWSIETGTYLEKKYYYSEGKYFNTSKISMPPNSWIDDVSGDCKMIEIPVSVQYHFPSHKNSTWFAALGTSSYFMKKEDYTYNYYYGTTGPVPHYKEYSNSTNNFFSNLGISGGYTRRLGNFADLRVEPYVKVPVSGMGIGSLPLLSTGLQLGLTKKF